MRVLEQLPKTSPRKAALAPVTKCPIPAATQFFVEPVHRIPEAGRPASPSAHRAPRRSASTGRARSPTPAARSRLRAPAHPPAPVVLSRWPAHPLHVGPDRPEPDLRGLDRPRGQAPALVDAIAFTRHGAAGHPSPREQGPSSRRRVRTGTLPNGGGQASDSFAFRQRSRTYPIPDQTLNISSAVVLSGGPSKASRCPGRAA